MKNTKISLLLLVVSLFILSSCADTSAPESSEGTDTSAPESSEGTDTSAPESSGGISMELPLYEFEIVSIPDYKIDLSTYEFATPKIEILNEDDALQYGQYIFDEISGELSISIKYEPIGIIKDAASDAWGVSFGDGSIGNGYSIAFFSNGNLIAIWPEE